MLKAAPDLYEDLVPHWNAFIALAGSRPIGFGGAGPIPVSEVRHYLDLFGVSDAEEREEMLRMIQAIDRVWLEVQAERQDAKDKDKRPPERPDRKRKG